MLDLFLNFNGLLVKIIKLWFSVNLCKLLVSSLDKCI